MTYSSVKELSRIGRFSHIEDFVGAALSGEAKVDAMRWHHGWGSAAFFQGQIPFKASTYKKD